MKRSVFYFSIYNGSLVTIEYSEEAPLLNPLVWSAALKHTVRIGTDIVAQKSHTGVTKDKGSMFANVQKSGQNMAILVDISRGFTGPKYKLFINNSEISINKISKSEFDRLINDAAIKAG